MVDLLDVSPSLSVDVDPESSSPSSELLSESDVEISSGSLSRRGRRLGGLIQSESMEDELGGPVFTVEAKSCSASESLLLLAPRSCCALRLGGIMRSESVSSPGGSIGCENKEDEEGMLAVLH